jgi:hypothetical protein
MDVLEQCADKFLVALAGLLLRILDRGEDCGAVASLFDRIVWHCVLLGELT